MIRVSARAVLLDIEGTVSSIAFVRDAMFPYVRTHLTEFLNRHRDDPVVFETCQRVLQEACVPQRLRGETDHALDSLRPAIESAVHQLMDEDKKVTALKALQGMIWKEGFETGELRASLFPDVLPKLRAWASEGLEMAIYSSGSIAAQKLFFAHTTDGDLTRFFSDHFDTTIGGKKEPSSYVKIADSMRLQPKDILFISDVEAELQAANDVGMQPILSVRPGNDPVSQSCPFPTLTDFGELEVRRS